MFSSVKEQRKRIVNWVLYEIFQLFVMNVICSWCSSCIITVCNLNISIELVSEQRECDETASIYFLYTVICGTSVTWKKKKKLSWLVPVQVSLRVLPSSSRCLPRIYTSYQIHSLSKKQVFHTRKMLSKIMKRNRRCSLRSHSWFLSPKKIAHWPRPPDFNSIMFIFLTYEIIKKINQIIQLTLIGSFINWAGNRSSDCVNFDNVNYKSEFVEFFLVNL